MIIELFGLPGCGKSTFVKENLKKDSINVGKKYIYSDSRLKRNINKMRLCFTLLFTNVKKFYKCLKIISKFKFNSLKLRIKMTQYLISNVSMIELVKRNEKDKNCFLDEGILNVIWALSYNSNISEKEIDGIILELEEYIGEKIIYINTDVDIILKRLLDRNNKGGSELEHDVKENTMHMERATKIMEYIYTKISKTRNIECVKMN